MELEKLSFNQLKEMLSQFDKNDMFSTLIRKEMKNKYIQHQKLKNQQNQQNQQNQYNQLNCNTAVSDETSEKEQSFYKNKNTSNMPKPPIYPNDHSEYSISNFKSNISNPNNQKKNDETIDRDKLNMGLFSRFTNEIEINNFKKTQKNTIRLE